MSDEKLEEVNVDVCEPTENWFKKSICSKIWLILACIAPSCMWVFVVFISVGIMMGGESPNISNIIYMMTSVTLISFAVVYIFAALVSLIYTGFCLATNKKAPPQKADENKKKNTSKIILGYIIGLTLIGIICGVGASGVNISSASEPLSPVGIWQGDFEGENLVLTVYTDNSFEIINEYHDLEALSDYDLERFGYFQDPLRGFKFRGHLVETSMNNYDVFFTEFLPICTYRTWLYDIDSEEDLYLVPSDDKVLLFSASQKDENTMIMNNDGYYCTLTKT
jgi:hypothetical protein